MHTLWALKNLLALIAFSVLLLVPLGAQQVLANHPMVCPDGGFLNLNTNRINSDSKKIKDKHPNLQFGNLQQNGKTVWICGTPGHLENTLNALKQSDEKSEPIFQMTTISEEPKLVEEPKPPVEELPLIKPKKLKRRKKKPSTLILNARPPQKNSDFDSIYDISIYD